jgi:hypothetical protein
MPLLQLLQAWEIQKELLTEKYDSIIFSYEERK